jgi:hypothetical protein
VQIKDLTFLRAKNKLVFECKQTQIKPKKGAKEPLLCGTEVDFATQKAPSGGLE